MSTGESSPDLPLTLTGYPAVATEAYVRFKASRNAPDLEAFLLHTLDFLLERDPSESILEMPDETRLADDLGADSLLVAELVFLLEELFQIRLDNEKIMGIRTLGDLQALVRREVAV